MTCGGYSRPMTDLTRGARSRRGGRRPGWLLLTVLLVLAIAASSALVFTNRVELLKLAVILASVGRGGRCVRVGHLPQAERHRPGQGAGSEAGLRPAAGPRDLGAPGVRADGRNAAAPRAGLRAARPGRRRGGRLCAPNWPRCAPIWRSCSTPTCRIGRADRDRIGRREWPRSRSAGGSPAAGSTPRTPRGDRRRADAPDTEESPIIDVPAEPHPPEHEWMSPVDAAAVRTAGPPSRRRRSSASRRGARGRQWAPPPPPPPTARPPEHVPAPTGPAAAVAAAAHAAVTARRSRPQPPGARTGRRPPPTRLAAGSRRRAVDPAGRTGQQLGRAPSTSNGRPRRIRRAGVARRAREPPPEPVDAPPPVDAAAARPPLSAAGRRRHRTPAAPPTWPPSPASRRPRPSPSPQPAAAGGAATPSAERTTGGQSVAELLARLQADAVGRRPSQASRGVS